MKQASLLLAGARVAPWLKFASAADAESVNAQTSAGRVHGTVVDDIKIFKGIPYGGPTSRKNRFMPPTKPAAWTGLRDALNYGPTAPQGGRNFAEVSEAIAQSEDCLVLNVFTPSLGFGRAGLEIVVGPISAQVT